MRYTYYVFILKRRFTFVVYFYPKNDVRDTNFNAGKAQSEKNGFLTVRFKSITWNLTIMSGANLVKVRLVCSIYIAEPLVGFVSH